MSDAGHSTDRRRPRRFLGGAPEGLVVAAGFHGRGVMTAPVAAAVRALVSDADAPFPLDAFALDRFDSRSRAFPFYGVEESYSRN